MNDVLKVFENQEFGLLRTIQMNGEVWLAGKDVAMALGYERAGKAIIDHVDEEDRKMIDGKTQSRFGIELGQRGGWMINESGLYSLILSSKMPTARKFKRWVTSEVLPSIRKHGTYMTDSVLEKVMEQPEAIYTLAEQLLAERAANKEAAVRLAVAQPKADYFDQFVNAADTTNIRNSGKELGIPQKKFVEFMLAHKYLYREAKLNGQLMPTAPAAARGYFIVRDVYTRTGLLVQQTFMTCKGKEHFRKRMALIREEIK